MAKLIFLFFMISSPCFAVLTIQMQGNYNSDTDNSTNFKYSSMMGGLFLGASFGASDRLYLGQSVSQYSRSHQNNGATNNQITAMELGPRLLFYFNEMKSWYISATWNPYVKGTRNPGTSEDISGMSYQLSFGCQTRLTRQIGLGFSMNYHTLSISKKVVGTTSTNVSESYSGIVPMVELAFHFR